MKDHPENQILSNTITPEQLVFRVGTKADLPTVMDLYAQTGLDRGDQISPLEAEKIFDRMSDYPDYKLYVTLYQGKIVGTLTLLIIDNLVHKGSPSGVIEDVAVDPNYQSLGIGSFMVRHALVIAGEKQCYKVMLSSNMRRERAHAFYESLNFERHGYSFRADLSTSN